MQCATDGCHNEVSWWAKLKPSGGGETAEQNVLLAVCLLCGMAAMRLGGSARRIGGEE